MPLLPPILPQSFYARPAREVAAALLGKLLVRTIDGHRVSGRIVETEAYCDSSEPDLACHGTKNGGRPTARSATMFGPPGHAYIYFTYGNHWMFNVVSGRDGQANAVLIRALEPVSGIPHMTTRRRGVETANSNKRLAALTNGPGKLAQAMAIDKQLNGTPLFETTGMIWIEDAAALPAAAITTGPRIGLGQTPEPWLSIPWRFWIKENPFVSPYHKSSH
ncbi:MAG: DNA-3-methyladenine glycosylase [Anaerolineae bacterium]|nr:DNA-3-methyladenine glycosylase [Anaerolineae bacterium]